MKFHHGRVRQSVITVLSVACASAALAQTPDPAMRHALAIALTGMTNDREITRARAIEIARMVLRGNAIRLYGWNDRLTP